MAHRDLMIDSPPKVGRRKQATENPKIHTNHQHSTSRGAGSAVRPLPPSSIGEAGTTDVHAEMRIQRIKESRLLYRTPQSRSAIVGKVDDMLKDTLPKYHRHMHDHHHSNQSIVSHEQGHLKIPQRMTQSTPNLSQTPKKSRIPVLDRTKFPLSKETVSQPDKDVPSKEMEPIEVEEIVEEHAETPQTPVKGLDYVDAEIKEDVVEDSPLQRNRLSLPAEIISSRNDISSSTFSLPPARPESAHLFVTENYIKTEPFQWSTATPQTPKELEAREENSVDLVNYLKINRREHLFKPERWESAFTFTNNEQEAPPPPAKSKEVYYSLPSSDVNLDRYFDQPSHRHYVVDEEPSDGMLDESIDYWIKQTVPYETAHKKPEKRENKKVLEFSIYLNGDADKEKSADEEVLPLLNPPPLFPGDNVFLRNHIILNDPIFLANAPPPDQDDQFSMSESATDDFNVEHDLEEQAQNYLFGFETATAVGENQLSEPAPVEENMVVEQLPPPEPVVTESEMKPVEAHEQNISKASWPLKPQASKNTEKCCVCNKTVYLMEMVILDSSRYHKGCFKCFTCSTTLNTNNFYKVDAYLYCRSHYKSPSHLTPTPAGKELPAGNTSTKSAISKSMENIVPPDNSPPPALSITTPAGIKASTLPGNSSKTPAKYRSEFFTSKSNNDTAPVATIQQEKMTPPSLQNGTSQVKEQPEDSSAGTVNVGGNQMKLVTKKEVWV